MASGVTVSEKVGEEVKEMRMHSKHSYLIINFAPSFEDPQELVVGATGKGSYEDFLEAIQKEKGCYAVVDVPLADKPGSKLLLLSWAPDTLQPKPKMLVAATFSAVKSKLVGCLQHQASDLSDLELSVAQSRVERKV